MFTNIYVAQVTNYYWLNWIVRLHYHILPNVLQVMTPRLNAGYILSTSIQTVILTFRTSSHMTVAGTMTWHMTSGRSFYDAW